MTRRPRRCRSIRRGGCTTASAAARAATSSPGSRRPRASTFPTALEILARRVGITLTESPGEQRRRGRRELLVAAVGDAVAFYHERLKTGDDAGSARSYLRGRGYDGAVVDQFSLGYSPPAWDTLVTHLTAKGHEPADDPAGRARLPVLTRSLGRPLPGSADVPHHRPAGRPGGVRGPRPGGRRAQVPQHPGDADLPQVAAALSGSTGRSRRSSAATGRWWWRATRMSSPSTSPATRWRWPPAVPPSVRSTSTCCAGSATGSCSPSTATPPAPAPRCAASIARCPATSTCAWHGSPTGVTPPICSRRAWATR